MRLSPETIDQLATDVERFTYDRSAQAIGIVHLGLGAFHRAHQAWYTDRAMEGGDRDWAIAGVSLRSRRAPCELMPQAGLYSVTERSGACARTRLIGSIRAAYSVEQDHAGIEAVLASPQTRIVTLTVTEKGYCRLPDGSLDMDSARSASIYSLLANAISTRHRSGTEGFSILSCDNLPGNGQILASLLRQYLDKEAPHLTEVFEAAYCSPSSMVDRIVPATTPTDRTNLAEAIGLTDEAGVFTEPFTQWIIEDRFAAGRPSWEKAGAQLVDDVAPFETAKLRMLNGAHSALAYLGLDRGLTFVHEAVADRSIRPVIEALMRREAAPTIAVGPGQDLEAYADSLLNRFENAALAHRLDQIATDGSQKIPQRWLETLSMQARHGQQCPAILAALGAWLRHVRGPGSTGRRVVDPLAGMLADLWREAGASGIVMAVFGPRGILASDWKPSASDLSVLGECLRVSRRPDA